jgi:hypothetical protein
LKILASLHLQPSVKELSTPLQANIAALILAMIAVSPNLLSAEFSDPGTAARRRWAISASSSPALVNRVQWGIA